MSDQREGRDHSGPPPGGGQGDRRQRQPVGVRELKNRASAIVSEVRERATEYVVTVRGEPVAVLRPFTGDDARRLRHERALASLDAIDAVAAEIAAAWRSDRSAVELVAEQRR